MLKMLLMCLLFSLSFQGHSQSPASKNQRTLEFCTNVGPVELTLKDDSITGRYLLTVTPELKKGIIKGTINKGLAIGMWSDPDGVGSIIFGFNPTFTRFIAIYNTGNDATNWYNEWKGVNKATIKEIKGERRQDLYCDWK